LLQRVCGGRVFWVPLHAEQPLRAMLNCFKNSVWGMANGDQIIGEF
jgi:hypothetical protein